jgi:plastocyanin
VRVLSKGDFSLRDQIDKGDDKALTFNRTQNHQGKAMTKLRAVSFLTLVALILSMSVSGCSKKSENPEAPSAAAQKAPTAIDQSTVGTISGKVSYTGEKPKAKVIHMDTEPACVAANSAPVYTQELEVNPNNTLKDVFVSVTDGLNNYTFAVPTTPAQLDQRGCTYHPHVLGVMAGQALQVLNSDNTTHNIHPMPKENPEWNTSMPPKATPLDKKFNRPETMIPVKCNVHPWMKAYIGVVKNPFFSVTGDDGSFEIKGLPPGDYTLSAWQEKLGIQTSKVTVGPKETKTVDFSFKGE